MGAAHSDDGPPKINLEIKMYHGYTLRCSHDVICVYAGDSFIDYFHSYDAAERFVDSLRAI